MFLLSFRGTSPGYRNRLTGAEQVEVPNSVPWEMNLMHQDILRADQQESCLSEKSLGVLRDIKLTLNQQCAHVAKRTSNLLGCIRQSITEGQRRWSFLCMTLVRYIWVVWCGPVLGPPVQEKLTERGRRWMSDSESGDTSRTLDFLVMGWFKGDQAC